MTMKNVRGTKHFFNYKLTESKINIFDTFQKLETIDCFIQFSDLTILKDKSIFLRESAPILIFH